MSKPSAGWAGWRQIAALSLLLIGHPSAEAQPLPTVAVERDGDTFHVSARAGVRLEYESHFELAEPLPPIVGDLFGTAMVTKTVRLQSEAMVREMMRRQAGRALIERSR